LPEYKHMVVFQALTWEPRDTDEEHHVSIFGKTEDGKSVCVTTAFDPYFFIKLSFGTSQQTINEIYNILCNKCPECITSYSMSKSKDVWGFQNNEEFTSWNNLRILELVVVLIAFWEDHLNLFFWE